MKYSVIIPVFNERDSVGLLISSLKGVLHFLGGGYEIIFVNDGSSDDTLERLQAIAKTDPWLEVINFKENQGQGRALEEGFRKAGGEVVITMDADLQNDPADISLLISKVNEGYDLVCGWRYSRKDNFIKIIKSRIANFLQRRITGLKLHDMSCTFRAYRRNILNGIAFNGRFDFSLLPYIISQRHRVKIAEVKIRHNRRKFGVTKYKVLDTILGTMFSYMKLLVYSTDDRRLEGTDDHRWLV